MTALGKAKARLAPLRDVRAALDAGYRAAAECQSDENGAVGIRYERPEHDSTPRRSGSDAPSALWYFPDGVGRVQRRLAAAEWPVGPGGSGPFGESPRVATAGGVVRTWLWSDNPGGVFAPSNAAEACTDAEAARRAHVAQHECEELVGVHPLGAAAARRRLPASVRPLLDDEGDARLVVRSAACRSMVIEGEVVEDVEVAQVGVMVEAPDATGDRVANWYLWSWATTAPRLHSFLASTYRDTEVAISLLPQEAISPARATGSGEYVAGGPGDKYAFAIVATTGTSGVAVPVTVHFWAMDRTGRFLELAGYSELRAGSLRGVLRAPKDSTVHLLLDRQAETELSPGSSANVLPQSFGIFRQRAGPAGAALGVR